MTTLNDVVEELNEIFTMLILTQKFSKISGTNSIAYIFRESNNRFSHHMFFYFKNDHIVKVAIYMCIQGVVDTNNYEIIHDPEIEVIKQIFMKQLKGYIL